MRPLFYPACGAATIALSLHVAQSFGDAHGPSAERQEQWNQAREQPLQQRAEIRCSPGWLPGEPRPDKRPGEELATFEAALRNAAKPREPWTRPDRNQARNEGWHSPIDMMRRFSQRTGEQSTNLFTLANVASPLYASLDDKQKLVFDATLRAFCAPRPFGAGRPGPWRFDRRG
jgi:hypothetical protein